MTAYLIGHARALPTERLLNEPAGAKALSGYGTPRPEAGVFAMFPKHRSRTSERSAKTSLPAPEPLSRVGHPVS